MYDLHDVVHIDHGNNLKKGWNAAIFTKMKGLGKVICVKTNQNVKKRINIHIDHGNNHKKGWNAAILTKMKGLGKKLYASNKHPETLEVRRDWWGKD